MECPVCGSRRIVAIEYGLPSDEIFQAAELGAIEIGGCCVFFDDDGQVSPTAMCRACGAKWHERGLTRLGVVPTPG